MNNQFSKEMYIESDKSEHKYTGWFFDYITKKFYRWDDLISLLKSRN